MRYKSNRFLQMIYKILDYELPSGFHHYNNLFNFINNGMLFRGKFSVLVTEFLLYSKHYKLCEYIYDNIIEDEIKKNHIW